MSKRGTGKTGNIQHPQGVRLVYCSRAFVKQCWRKKNCWIFSKRRVYVWLYEWSSSFTFRLKFYVFECSLQYAHSLSDLCFDFLLIVQQISPYYRPTFVFIPVYKQLSMQSFWRSDCLSKSSVSVVRSRNILAFLKQTQCLYN